MHPTRICCAKRKWTIVTGHLRRSIALANRLCCLLPHSSLSPSAWPGLPSLSACQPVSPPSTTTPRLSSWWDRGVSPASTPAASIFSCHPITPLQAPPSLQLAPPLHPGYLTCLPTTSPRLRRHPPLLRGWHTRARYLSTTLTPSLLPPPMLHPRPHSTAFPFPLSLQCIRDPITSPMRTTAPSELLKWCLRHKDL